MIADPQELPLLEQLRLAVHTAPRPVQRIEVGVALSIALGRQRPEVSCGGCSVPLEFEGIPAVTRIDLGTPFRLLFDVPAPGSATQPSVS
jgi:hypothetical protein